MNKKEFIDYKTLGERIRKLRLDNKLTQEDLAEIIGKSDNFISKIESNNSSISLNTLVSLTKALNTSMDYLLFESIERDKTENDIIIDSILKDFSEVDKDFVVTMLQAMKTHKK